VDNLVINSSQRLITNCKVYDLVKLTKNWPDFIRPPEAVYEAVDRLMAILEDEHKAVIASLRGEDLIDLHYDLGLAIRNAFGLHEPNSKLLASCGIAHPDDVAEVIINKIWARLKHGD
jgi:hypothetical protein